MIRIIGRDDRHYNDFGWLKTYWLFSFSSYFDPYNIQFGALRAFNDDVVTPMTGFPTHPHQEMEIVTVVLDGEMTHEDSLGNKTVIRANDVQRMSAGLGLTHSEFNLAEQPVHFYQLWLLPDERGLQPSYDQKSYDPASWRNLLFPIASGQGLPGAVTFHTDATIYRSSLDADRALVHEQTRGRRIFIYLTRGKLEVNCVRMNEKDQARIDIDEALFIEAKEDSDFVMVDEPTCKGWGYSQQTHRGDRSKSAPAAWHGPQSKCVVGVWEREPPAPLLFLSPGLEGQAVGAPGVDADFDPGRRARHVAVVLAVAHVTRPDLAVIGRPGMLAGRYEGIAHRVFRADQYRVRVAHVVLVVETLADGALLHIGHQHGMTSRSCVVLQVICPRPRFYETLVRSTRADLETHRVSVGNLALTDPVVTGIIEPYSDPKRRTQAWPL